MSTIGGLLQLIATGIQDTPIINQPEITFFKKVYKKSTDFAICGIEKNVGLIKFNQEKTILLDNTGDLLYSLYFKININKINKINNNITISKYYDTSLLNQYDIIFNNNYCLIFQYFKETYIIPYNILQNYNIKYTINKLDKSLFINQIDQKSYYNILLQYNIIYFNIKYDNIENNNINIIENIQYINYWYNNINISNGELDEYNKFINNEITIDNESFDMDVVYNYCNNNYIDFNLYRDNTLIDNPLIILIILSLLYNFNDKLIFTFWKKYNIYNNNNVNLLINIDNYNFSNEWKEQLDNLIINNFNTNQIYNQISDIFTHNYLLKSIYICNIYKNTNTLDKASQDIYIKLKVIYDRFYTIFTNNEYSNLINFNDNYLGLIYSSSNYNNNNYKYLLNKAYINYNLLQNNYNNLDFNNFINNLNPIDLLNIYGLIAYDISNYNQIDKSIQSFIILWKNWIHPSRFTDSILSGTLRLWKNLGYRQLNLKHIFRRVRRS
jgi:hypothetical protein